MDRLERTRGWRRTAARLAIICLSLTAAACAPAAPYNPDRLPAAQMGRIGEICRTVIGLPGGVDTHSLACQESLSHSFAEQREVAALHPDQGASGAQADQAPLPAPPAKSYFSASNDEVDRRERAACVAIGLDPATGAFARCVVDLAGRLFDVDNPLWRD